MNGFKVGDRVQILIGNGTGRQGTVVRESFVRLDGVGPVGIRIDGDDEVLAYYDSEIRKVTEHSTSDD